MRKLCLTALLIMGVISYVSADVVHLKAGGQVEGQATRRGSVIEIRTAEGTLRYPLSAVDRIEWRSVAAPSAAKPAARPRSAAPDRSAVGRPPATSWRARVQQEFNRTVTLDFSDTPLPDVIAFLQNLTDLNFVLDTKNIGDPADIPITLRVHDLSLQNAFEWILRQADLKYALRKGVVFISDPETIQGDLERRVYDARDLLLVIADKPGGQTQLGGGGGGGSSGGSGGFGSGGGGGMSMGGGSGGGDDDSEDEMDLDERGAGIVQLILRTVQPDSWGDAFVIGTGGGEDDEDFDFF